MDEKTNEWMSGRKASWNVVEVVNIDSIVDEAVEVIT